MRWKEGGVEGGRDVGAKEEEIKLKKERFKGKRKEPKKIC